MKPLIFVCLISLLYFSFNCGKGEDEGDKGKENKKVEDSKPQTNNLQSQVLGGKHFVGVINLYEYELKNKKLPNTLKQSMTFHLEFDKDGKISPFTKVNDVEVEGGSVTNFGIVKSKIELYRASFTLTGKNGLQFKFDVTDYAPEKKKFSGFMNIDIGSTSLGGNYELSEQ